MKEQALVHTKMCLLYSKLKCQIFNWIIGVNPFTT